ncbi:mannose-1-phosphate guanylyltransferase 1 [mine drainage metagenome]|uniref:mannose-1-phosphate guanylyltransferase n=1 Tax=mine drainage metagenome TaxID=410659 RepID=A0A1J5QH07_9ZZZZ
MINLLPVILSGGSGTRLWPLSRQQYPKQLLMLVGEHTMLQTTALRISKIDLPDGWHAELPMVVGQEDCRFLTAVQLQEVGLAGSRILLEPAGRNTAPALTLAALTAISDGTDPVMVVMPADHVISDLARFQDALSKALPLAARGRVVTFGVVPTSAETGYGYIRCGAPINADAAAGPSQASEIVQFVEKPGQDTAREYLSDGHFLWNSGIYLLHASVWITQMESFRPDMLQACREAVAGGTSDHDFVRVDRSAFLACPSESIDYAVMEPLALNDHAHKLGAVQPLNAGWSDVGAWHALLDIGDKDADGNVLSGDVLALACNNSLVRAESRLVACIGMQDAVVVETVDAVLVVHRDQLHLVKDAVTQLKLAGRSECDLHRKVHKPWGYYDGIDVGHRFQVKRLVVTPGASLSLQMHHHRAEHWIVVMGTAKVTRGNEEFLLSENQSTYIPLGVVHRLENPGVVPLEIIEVQSGAYLGEDDIVRFQDHYSRNELAHDKHPRQLGRVLAMPAAEHGAQSRPMS